jgi:dTDP-4-amino-4,6-dideoxygalactose transaminase
MTMTTTAAPQQETTFTLRPRPKLGLGAAIIGREEEALVLDVIRRKEPFRYYGHHPEAPPPMAATLEKEFAAKIGMKYALCVTSGTAALEVAMAALGIGPGDEVIVPAWSWISCYTAIVRVGALPVLAEINDTMCLAPGEIKRLKTPRTKAALVIHYQGVAAEMDELLAEAKEAGITLIEDACESMNATYKGKQTGSMGPINCFSFQNNKFMTAGEGGCVVTNDPKLYERAVRFHDIGQVRAYHANIVKPTQEAFPGDQFRITELQAALALAQLRKTDYMKAHCRKLQAHIVSKIQDLKGIKVRRIPDPTGDTGFEIYISLPSQQQAVDFRNKLNALNVNCNKTTGTYAQYERDYVKSGKTHAPGANQYPQGGTWPAKGYRKEDFPKTEDIITKFVALPLGMLYTEEDADYIASAVKHVHGQLLG